MKRQPRLSRSEVVARLRALAAQHGGMVSPGLVGSHDGALLRSVRLHFASFAMACRAARVALARRAPRSVLRRPGAVWSRARVVRELRRLDAEGASTGWAELMQRGPAGLVGAAAAYAGGLQRARAAAGIARPGRRRRARWDHAAIVGAIAERARAGLALASSKAPQRLVAAARWHFGSWEAALAAAGIDAAEVRLQRGRYTEAEILERIRAMARDGTPVRSSTLRGVVKLDTVRRLFGSVDAAIRAAGIAQVVAHGNQTWSRERVIEELTARAARGETRLTRGLERAVQLHFGAAREARAAAGLSPLVRAPWTRPSLIRELQRRARRGESARTLWGACTRLFGSVAAARRAARLPAPRRSAGMAAWDRRALLRELRRRLAARQQLGRGLTAGLRRAFGSLAAARAAARARSAAPDPPPRSPRHARRGDGKVQRP